MKKLMTICLVATMILIIGSVAYADWQPGEPHKMHYPQLPDPLGWDVAFDHFTPLADDWRCSKTGPVSDIHLWLSWMGDQIGEISALHMAIYNDIPYDEYTNPFSTPGNILWERTILPVEMSFYNSGDQGFFNPHGGPPIAHDHENFYQINITDIQDPFTQEAGNIYWLGIYAEWNSGEFPDYFYPGWKTSENHFNDGAVYLEGGYWMQLVYPYNDPLNRNGLPIDLAFVITPEPATICLLGLGALSLVIRKK